MRLVGANSVKRVDMFCAATEISWRFLGIRVVALSTNKVSEPFLRVFFRVNNGINFLLSFSVYDGGVAFRIRLAFHQRSPFLQIINMGGKIDLKILWQV